MRRSRDRISNVQAGVLALVLGVLLTYLGFTKGHIPFLENPYQVKAVFKTAASEIRKGSPVRIAGVEVGRVTKVERGPGSTALVTMKIKDEGRPLHADATMKIRPRLFLEGNFFVDVRPGSSAAPEIRDGGTIPVSQTAVPVQIDQVLNVLQRDVRSDLQGTLKGLAGALDGQGGKDFNALGKDGPAALANSAIVGQAALGDQPDDLSRFIAGSAKVADAVAARDRELDSLIGAFATTTSTLADRSSDLSSSLVALDSTLRTASPNLRAVNTALPALRRFSARLDPSLNRAPAAIAQLRPFVRNAAGLVSADELPALAQALRSPLRNLVTTEPGLTQVLTKLRPIGRCLARNVVPTLNKAVDDGKLSTGLPAWKELGRLGVGLSSAGSTFDGNGGAIRYSAGASENTIASNLGSLTDLVAIGGQQVSGARPRWTPGQTPPFAPYAPCEEQDLPDLTAESVAPAKTRTTRLSDRTITKAASAATNRLKQLVRSPTGLENALRKVTR